MKCCNQILLKVVVLFIGLSALSSCSPEKQCHRLEKKIVKNARFCQLVLKDTITVKDTVYIGTVKHDSTFVMSKEVDTFYLNKERLHVEVIRDHDTLIVSGKCDSVFVVKEIQVPYESVHVKELNTWLRGFGKWGKRLLWLAIILVVVYLLRKTIWALMKKIPFVRNYLP